MSDPDDCAGSESRAASRAVLPPAEYTAPVSAVLVVGDTKRANAWSAALRQSPAVAEVRRVAASPSAVRSAIAAATSTQVAIAVGGALGRWLAETASGLGATGVVSAPAGASLPDGFSRAPDFDSVPGVGWLAKHLSSATELHLKLQGSVDGNSEDLREVVGLGMAVLARLGIAASVRDLFLEGDSRARLQLESPPLQKVSLDASAGGSALRIRARGLRSSVEVRVESGQEVRTLHGRGQPQTRQLGLPNAAAFALAPLRQSPDAMLPPPGIEEVDVRLHELPPPPTAFEFLRRLASRWPDDAGAWQASGTLARADAVDDLQDPLGASRLELMAFAAGQKPAVILAVADAEAQALSRRFPHSQSLPHEGGKLWLAARSENDLRQLVARRSAPDPDEHLPALGSLLGYPSCCVEAFSRQHDRGDDARSRYIAALRTSPESPWPWELNNCGVRVVPFFPCSYACAHAEREAKRVLTLLEAAEPTNYQNLRKRLAAPVFFFDEGAFIRVERLSDTERKVGIPKGAPAWLVELARVLACTGQLRVRPNALQILRDGSIVAEAQRNLPLGFWMPFGAP